MRLHKLFNFSRIVYYKTLLTPSLKLPKFTNSSRVILVTIRPQSDLFANAGKIFLGKLKDIFTDYFEFLTLDNTMND